MTTPLVTDPHHGSGPAGRTLVLVRHGESAWNASRRFQGHVGEGLSARGHAQAAATAAHLAERFPGPWHVVRSDLTRVAETAAPLVERTGATEAVDPRWRELDMGAWSGRTYDEIARTDPEGLAAWRGFRDLDAMERESYATFRARVSAALDDARHPGDDGGVTVVVTHGGTVRIAVAAVLGLPPGSEHVLAPARNTSLTVLADTDGALRLRSYNEGEHLAALVGTEAALPG